MSELWGECVIYAGNRAMLLAVLFDAPIILYLKYALNTPEWAVVSFMVIFGVQIYFYFTNFDQKGNRVF